MTPTIWAPFTVANGRITLTGEPMPGEGTVLVGYTESTLIPIEHSNHPWVGLKEGLAYFVPLDIFAPVAGPVVDKHGNMMSTLLDASGFPTSDHRRAIPGDGCPFTRQEWILRDVFRQLDQRPKVKLLCVTGHLYKVRCAPPWPLVRVHGHVSQNKGDGYHRKRLENLTIHAGPIRCQADLERLAPGVLELRDLCKVGLWFDRPGEQIEVPICVHSSNDQNQTDHSECSPTIQSILLTNRNQHSDDVAQQVEGAVVEVWRV